MVVPSGVTVSVTAQTVHAKGKLGELERTFTDDVDLLHEDGKITVKPRNDGKRARMMWGTSRTLVANLVTGVSEGFTRKLDITGVGYRAQVQGREHAGVSGHEHSLR